MRAATAADLDREVPWGTETRTTAQLAQTMLFHTGSHTGQLLDLRRALNMPPLF